MKHHKSNRTDWKIVVFLVFFIGLFINSGCGDLSGNESSLFDTQIGGNEGTKVPFPPFGCRQVFRGIEAKLGIKKKYEKLFAMSDTPAYSGTQSANEYLIALGETLGQVNTALGLNSASTDTYIRLIPSIEKGYAAKIGKVTGMFGDYTLPCSTAIMDLAENLSPTFSGSYESFFRYFEPRRILGVSAKHTVPRNQQIEDTAAALANFPVYYFAPDGTMVEIPKPFSHKQILTRMFNENVPMSQAFLQKAQNLTPMNKPATFEHDQEYRDREGFPGFWHEQDEFEQRWNGTFAQLALHLDGCNFSFDGSQKRQIPDVPSPKCILNESADGKMYGSVASSLVTSLIFMDLSGVAYSEGDDESARVFLEIAQETLKLAIDIGIGLTPAGRAKDIVEAIGGYSIIPNFEELSAPNRVISAIGAATTGSGPIKAIAKYVGKSAVAKNILKKGFTAYQGILRNSDEIVEAASKIGITAVGDMKRFGRVVQFSEKPLLDAVPADLHLIGVGDPLKKAATWVKPFGEKFNVIIHGSEEAFHVLHEGKYVQLSHRDIATYIRANGWNGKTPIRLLSCKTGSCDTGAAKNLANKLGVTVEAPSDTLWFHPDGNLTIGPDAKTNSGIWKIFTPGE